MYFVRIMPELAPLVLLEMFTPEKVAKIRCLVCSCAPKGDRRLYWYSATSLHSPAVDEFAGSLNCNPRDFCDEQPGL